MQLILDANLPPVQGTGSQGSKFGKLRKLDATSSNFGDPIFSALSLEVPAIFMFSLCDGFVTQRVRYVLRPNRARSRDPKGEATFCIVDG